MIESLNYHFHSQEKQRKTPNHYDNEFERMVSNYDEWEEFDTLKDRNLIVHRLKY